MPGHTVTRAAHTRAKASVDEAVDMTWGDERDTTSVRRRGAPDGVPPTGYGNLQRADAQHPRGQFVADAHRETAHELE